MSIGETAILTVKADTTQAVAATDKLTKSQEKLGREVGKSDAEVKKFDGTLGSLGGGFAKISSAMSTFGLAIAGVEKAIHMAKAVLDMGAFAARVDALRESVPTDAVEALTLATRGLVDEYTLLKLATRSTTGDLALSAKQIGLIADASVALASRGIGSITYNIEQLSEIMQEKKFGRLDDFKIKVRESGTDAEKAADAYDQFRKASAGVLEDKNAATQRAMVRMSNFWNNIKEGAGSSVNAFYAAGEALDSYTAKFDKMVTESIFGIRQLSTTIEQELPADLPFVGGIRSISPREDPIDKERLKAYEDRQKAMAARAKENRAKRDAQAKALTDQWDKEETEYLWKRHFEIAAEIRKAAKSTDIFKLKSTIAETGIEPERQYSAESGVDMTQLTAEERGPYTTAEGIETLREQSLAFDDTFSAMESGMAAAVEAAISGSDSIGAAFARASAGVLRAKAVEYSVLALGELAMGFASMAFGEVLFGSSTEHFKAAALFSAAAVAAGAGSAALGAMAGGGGGGGGGAFGGVGSTRPTPFREREREGQNIVINIGEGFVGDEAKLARTIQDHLDQAKRSGRARNDESRPVRFR